MSFMSLAADRESNPVDTIEQVAHFNDWMFERSGEHEISISVTGGESDYHISFSWMDNLETLHLACAFDLKVPEKRQVETVRLLALINEQLYVGHFDLWTSEGVVMYRQGLILAGGAEPSTTQCEAMLGAALEACERYYQAFQFVVWAGRPASEALAATLFETMGEA
ncbi:MAG TPA: YbjN domain-containing protein [Kaistiaceae bacterium]|nr:YbjN domain-containing protein [Kaistiaceae bacterium]